MKKLVLFSILICTIFASSCTKEETKTNKDHIVGTWTVRSGGEDGNGNGVLDASETIVSDDYKNFFVINDNGTASITYQRTASDPLEYNEYKYSLNGDETVITFTKSSGASAAYTIETLSGNNLTLVYQPAGMKKGWIFLTK